MLLEALQGALSGWRPRSAISLGERLSGSGSVPRGMGFGSEGSKRGAADQMALGLEGDVDRCMSGEETLS